MRHMQVNTFQAAWNIIAGHTTVEDFERQYIHEGEDDYMFYSPGGADIDPTLYGEEVTHTHLWKPELDRVEYALIELILKHRMPLLAICRGHQLVTAAIGGTLHQDIYEETGIRHSHTRVDLLPGSLIHSILVENRGHALFANSLHHQATKSLPLGWYPVAWSPDGIIEAIESKDYPGVISVQWHPELIHKQIDRIYDYLLQV